VVLLPRLLLPLLLFDPLLSLLSLLLLLPPLLSQQLTMRFLNVTP
jgi:hypothetical protein